MNDSNQNIWKAINNNDIKEVEKYLREGVDILQKYQGKTLFQWARDNDCDYSISKALIRSGVDLSQRNMMDVLWAVRTKELDIVEAFINSNADVNTGEPLYQAIVLKRVRIAKALIDAGADLDIPFNNPLIGAIEKNLPEVVETLIKAGANLEVNSQHVTALSLAIIEQNFEIAAMLVEAGADVNRRRSRDVFVYWEDPYHSATPLILSAAKGNLASVSMLMEAGADVAARDDLGRTALDIAIANNNQGVVDYLRIHSPETAKDNFALCVACSTDDEKKVQEILQEKTIDPNCFDLRKRFRGATPLIWGCCVGKVQIVEQLLQAGANPNQSEKVQENQQALQLDYKKRYYTGLSFALAFHRETRLTGKTPLFLASWKRHQKIVSLLLSAGADVNQTTFLGVTPLMVASFQGALEIVQSLLNAGAEINCSDILGTTALMFASISGHSEVIKLLIDRGANVQHKNFQGHTAFDFTVQGNHEQAGYCFLPLQLNGHMETSKDALLFACNQSDYSVVENLLQKSIATDSRSCTRETPLLIAASNNDLKMVQLLLQANADVNAMSDGAQTSLRYACRHGNTDMVNLLIQHKANLDIGGWTPLMEAANGNHINIANILLENGADINRVCYGSQTALKIAQWKKHEELAKILQQRGAKEEIEVTTQTQNSVDEELEHSIIDLSQAAQKESFSQTLQELSQICGSQPQPFENILGGYYFYLHSSKNVNLAQFQSQIAQKGFTTFFLHSSYCKHLAILPVADIYQAIEYIGVSAPNYNLDTSDIISWLKELELEQPFEVTDLGIDLIQGNFTSQIQNSLKLAKKLYRFCPDIHVSCVEELAEDLERGSGLYLWWD